MLNIKLPKTRLSIISINHKIIKIQTEKKINKVYITKLFRLCFNIKIIEVSSSIIDTNKIIKIHYENL